MQDDPLIVSGFGKGRELFKNQIVKQHQQIVPLSARDTKNNNNNLEETMRLSMRLSNLKVISPKVFQNKLNLISIDLRNNRLTSLPD